MMTFTDWSPAILGQRFWLISQGTHMACAMGFPWDPRKRLSFSKYSSELLDADGSKVPLYAIAIQIYNIKVFSCLI